ncbi:Syntaxin-21 [Cardamine amara subsp. amara]|uniref:Syntaxin-21 n=1 Tax=Cardamine amara subsp. amara TaxID=228776 RepID=A0ABD1B2X7_CARAN
MSFQDLEAGSRFQAPNRFTGGRQQRPLSRGDPSQEVAAGIFRISTAVNSFFRLVNSIGTPKDTLELRDKLQKTRLQISELVKNTSAKLKEASEADHLHGTASPIKKIADAKLAKDFQSVLKEFQKAQRLAAEREITYTPVVTKEIPTSYNAQELDTESLRISQQQTLLQQSRRQEVVFLDNEITFNEAIIEEREQGIREIQEQIGEVNEIFKDLAVLVNDQGIMIDDISSNIDNSHAATSQATAQLRKASKTQRANSSLTCLLILIFGIVLLIVIIVVLV